jgi:hypothetical protein
MSAAPKNYLNSIFIKEQTFNDGGSILKLSIRTAELIEELQKLDQNGWVNLDLKKRREPSAKGHTHYVEVSTFKPKDGPPEDAKLKRHQPMPYNPNEPDDLPF